MVEAGLGTVVPVMAGAGLVMAVMVKVVVDSV